MSSNDRVGLFTVPTDTIQEKLDAVRALMCNAGMVVLMAEQTKGGNINYMAISESFEKLDEGERVPWYTIESNDDGSIVATRIIPKVALKTEVPAEAVEAEVVEAEEDFEPGLEDLTEDLEADEPVEEDVVEAPGAE